MSSKLYPRTTAAHNVAFDAVIDAHLLRLLLHAGVDVRPFAELLLECYAADERPLFVPQPAAGLADRPDWTASRGSSPALRAIHRRLCATSPRAADAVTYGAILTTC